MIYSAKIFSLHYRALLEIQASPDATALMVYLEEEDHRGKTYVKESLLL